MGTLYASRNTAMTAQHLRDRHALRCCTCDDATGEPDFARWLVEAVLKVIEVLLSTILGHPVGKNVLISFTHARTSRTVARLIAAYDAAVDLRRCPKIPSPYRWHGASCPPRCTTNPSIAPTSYGAAN